MYICPCGLGHKLSDHHYSMLDGEREIRIKHEPCGFHIIIGADPCEDGYMMYSSDVDQIPEKERDTRLMKAIIVQQDIIPIRMKCGHDADWRGFTGSSICCSKCAWDKSGHSTGNKAAWEEDYEYTCPELEKAGA